MERDMRLVALITLLTALSGCADGAPALPQPEGPLIPWNTGMWNTNSNAVTPLAQTSARPAEVR
jgi:hypothetical protein